MIQPGTTVYVIDREKLSTYPREVTLRKWGENKCQIQHLFQWLETVNTGDVFEELDGAIEIYKEINGYNR